jgi:nucleolar protein 56
MPTYLLYESALGYALFLRNEMEEVALSKIQTSVIDFAKFNQMVKYVSFAPFETPEHGLENANNVSEGLLNTFLANFLDTNLGKVPKVRLGIIEPKLGGAIQEHLEVYTFIIVIDHQLTLIVLECHLLH